MKSLLAAIGWVAVATTSAAVAAPDACSMQAADPWISVETVTQKAESLGYAVKEIKRSKSCWKVEGYDRHGAEIEIHFNGASGAVIKPSRWRLPVAEQR